MKPYKVKVKDIQPDIYSLDDNIPKVCFLGISMSNPFSHGKFMSLVLKWIDSKFDKCIILIADHLHRFNEYIFKGDTDGGGIECIRMGKEIHQRLQDVINKIDNTNTKFKIIHWLELLETNEFKINKEKIDSYFELDENFRKSVIKSCEVFIEKQRNKGYQIHVSQDIAVKRSCDYVLEELAVFSLLIDRGYTVQVYPGTQLQVLKDLANNSFSNLNTSLGKGIYIDLSIKKVR